MDCSMYHFFNRHFFVFVTLSLLCLSASSLRAQTTETFAGPTIDPRLQFDLPGYDAGGGNFAHYNSQLTGAYAPTFMSAGGEDYYNMPILTPENNGNNGFWQGNSLNAVIDQVPTNWYLETKMRWTGSANNNYASIGFGIFASGIGPGGASTDSFYKVDVKNQGGQPNGYGGRFMDDPSQTLTGTTFATTGPGTTFSGAAQDWFAIRMEQITADIVVNGTTVVASPAAPAYVVSSSWAGDLNNLTINRVYAAAGGYDGNGNFFANNDATSASDFSGYNPNSFTKGQVVTNAYNRLNTVSLGQRIAFETGWTGGDTVAAKSSYDIALLNTNLLATIPEPSTMGLMGLVSSGMILLRRKKHA
jgi:hypothetical protein